MSPEEKDRLVEVLIYLYFNSKPEKVLGKAEFWTAIKNICDLYKIESLSISKSVRILMAKEHVPQDDEIYYLLSKMGMSVRPIRSISGIYWQKQVEFQKQFETKPPVIKRRITDVIVKRNMRDFIFALYEVLGIFGSIDMKTLEGVL
jgi:hypothetical protein